MEIGSLENFHGQRIVFRLLIYKSNESECVQVQKTKNKIRKVICERYHSTTFIHSLLLCAVVYTQCRLYFHVNCIGKVHLCVYTQSFHLCSFHLRLLFCISFNVVLNACVRSLAIVRTRLLFTHTGLRFNNTFSPPVPK